MTPDQVAERVAAGQTNRSTLQPSRTTKEIVRDNLLTRFNILLGSMLFVVLFILQEPRDALFGLVVLSNSAIGIIQEIRAKRTLDRLELIAAPKVRLVRGGYLDEHPIEEVVIDDLVDLKAGDQLVVDGAVTASYGLEVDESLLTGEADAIKKQPGDRLLSGSFVTSGTGRYQATAVGDDSYASRLARQAKQYSLARSELRDGINWILGAVSWAVIPIFALVIWGSVRAGDTVRDGLVGAVAAGVALIPQGLVLLTSIAFALGVIRLGRRNVLIQELPAVEGLARVDTVCFDKTGTLTEGRLAVEQAIALTDTDPSDGIAALVDAVGDPNATQNAIAEMFSVQPGWQAVEKVPFSSSRKWSGATFSGQGSWVMGAPDVLSPGNNEVAQIVATEAATGRRTILVATSALPLHDTTLPPDLQPVAILILSDRIRGDAAETIGYFADQNVTLKVISGDHPATVSAIAAEVGIANADRVVDAASLPSDPEQLAEVMEQNSVFGRVTPQQKQAMVKALQSRGHVVAMTGDGVNDVLALKDADIGIAVGSGAPASRAVAKVVLIDGRFSSLPAVVGEGRRVIANIERVANLFITSTVYAFVIAVSVSIARLPYPFLPRHLTLVGSLTIGIPAFFLALEASQQLARPGFVGRVLRFAVPVGVATSAATIFGYWLAESEGASVAEARTMATLILATVGFFAVGIVSRPLVTWKRILIGTLVLALVVVFSTPGLRDFFGLEVAGPLLTLAAVGISAITGSLMLLALHTIGWSRGMPGRMRKHIKPGE